jgi:hypothetical protein
MPAACDLVGQRNLPQQDATNRKCQVWKPNQRDLPETLGSPSVASIVKDRTQGLNRAGFAEGSNS